jgi:hypothetical protein
VAAFQISAIDLTTNSNISKKLRKLIPLKYRKKKSLFVEQTNIEDCKSNLHEQSLYDNNQFIELKNKYSLFYFMLYKKETNKTEKIYQYATQTSDS